MKADNMKAKPVYNKKGSHITHHANPNEQVGANSKTGKIP